MKETHQKAYDLFYRIEIKTLRTIYRQHTFQITRSTQKMHRFYHGKMSANPPLTQIHLHIQGLAISIAMMSNMLTAIVIVGWCVRLRPHR